MAVEVEELQEYRAHCLRLRKRREYHRKWRAGRPKPKKQARDAEYMRDYHLKRHYGITADDYDRMLEEQGGVCAICKEPETCTFKGTIKSLAVDHDHDTGRIRGLLCRRCNTILGLVDEKKSILKSLNEYL